MRELLDRLDVSYNVPNISEIDASRDLIRHVTLEQEMAAMYIRVFEKYTNKPKKSPVNKTNNAALRDVENVLHKYSYMHKKFDLVLLLMEAIDSLLYSQWLDIVSTNNQMRESLEICQKNLKKYGIGSTIYRSISYSIRVYKERMNRINKYILPEYIEMSPLKEYDDELQKHQESLNFLLTQAIFNDYNEDELSDLINDILLCADTEDYIFRLQKYREKQRNQHLAWRKDDEYKVKRSIALANSRLRKYSDTLRYRISHSNPEMNIDFDRLQELKEEGVEYVKIMYATYISQQTKSFFFVGGKNQLVSGLENAQIFRITETIPDDIQEMIDNCEIALSELVFHT